MSDIVKWGLLVAGALLIIGLILALPFVQFFNLGEFSALLGDLTSLISGVLISARGLLNNFLTPFGRTVLTGVLAYLFSKFFVTLIIRVTSWIYHFIFK